MTIQIDTTISTTVKIPFVAINNDTGRNDFDHIMLKDGVVYDNLLAPIVYSEIGGGMYVAQVTFTETGLFTFFIDDHIAATVLVRERSLTSYLVNIEDQAIGSWQWNKETKEMTMYRQNGQVLSTFTLDDGLSISQRVRT